MHDAFPCWVKNLSQSYGEYLVKVCSARSEDVNHLSCLPEIYSVERAVSSQVGVDSSVSGSGGVAISALEVTRLL